MVKHIETECFIYFHSAESVQTERRIPVKKWSIRLLAVSLCVLLLAIPVLGAETVPSAAPAVPYSGNIYIEGIHAGCWNQAGDPLPFLSCNGTVYVSLWTAGQWMGASALWDPKTQTISIITGQQEPTYPTTVGSSPYQYDHPGSADVVFLSDASICLDGEKFTFTNALGEVAEPLLCQGEVYLPVRGVAETLGKRVLWRGRDHGESNIYIYDPPTFVQNQEATSYYIQVLLATDKLRTMLTALEEDSSLAGLELRDPAVQEKLAQLEAVALPIRELTPPASGAFSIIANDLNRKVRYLVDVDLARYLHADVYLPPECAGLGWDWHKEHFLRTMWMDHDALYDELQYLRIQFLEVEKLEAKYQNQHR